MECPEGQSCTRLAHILRRNVELEVENAKLKAALHTEQGLRKYLDSQTGTTTTLDVAGDDGD